MISSELFFFGTEHVKKTQ